MSIPLSADTIAADLKDAAEEVEREHPGAHVIVIAIQNRVISLHAKSPVINEKLDIVGALDWVVNETIRRATGDMAEKLNPPDATSPDSEL